MKQNLCVFLCAFASLRETMHAPIKIGRRALTVPSGTLKP